MTPFIFRTRTAPPTETGWYYGQWIGTDPIIPREVEDSAVGFVVVSDGFRYSVDRYAWFGPVPQVRECQGELT